MNFNYLELGCASASFNSNLTVAPFTQSEFSTNELVALLGLSAS